MPSPKVEHVRRLTVELGERSYPIRIGAGLLNDRAAFAEIAERDARLITDEHVAAHHLKKALRTLGLPREHVLTLPPGETQKTWDNAGRVLDWLLQSQLARDGCVVALGGGVIGDLAGFASAIYLRGVDYVQAPTTLLAQVDSAVGGKTAVNHPRGKNLIGVFHQPIAVVADIATLATLPPRELRAGLAEVIKYGLLADAELFAWLENVMDRLLALDAAALAEAVERCCAIKARIVAADEREAGPRALLNLGHSFGHAIETHTGYGGWLHGEAVGAGLCMAADLSARIGWLPAAEAERCVKLATRAGLPVAPPAGMTPADFLRLMAGDKKVQAGKLRLVLLRGIGDAVVTSDFDPAKLQATLEQVCLSSAAR